MQLLQVKMNPCPLQGRKCLSRQHVIKWLTGLQKELHHMGEVGAVSVVGRLRYTAVAVATSILVN